MKRTLVHRLDRKGHLEHCTERESFLLLIEATAFEAGDQP